jgi:putative ABC transport system permease protein
MMALGAVRANKLRSFLTLVGVAVGVFSIISVMTAVGVLRSSIEQGLTQLGANTFQIQKFPAGFGSSHEQRRRLRNRKDITYEQALVVRDRMTNASAVGIEIYRRGKVVVWEGKKTNPNTTLFGETPQGIETNNWAIARGRGFTSQDLEMGRDVILLGGATHEYLFPPHVDPLGEQVRVDGHVFQVIGVFEKKGAVLGGDADNFVVIPITTYFDAYGRVGRSLSIMIQAKSRALFDDAIEEARSILRAARSVPPGEEDDFSYFSNDSLIQQFNEFTFYVRLGVLVVASIALVAAGVGIMNIMLVSVTERTREIGIRKAIGAQRTDVLSQFMVEAIILCQVGGVTGIVLGVLAGNVVGILLEVPAVIPWEWVGIGLAACTSVGLVFGVYPAWKASDLDPIEALRYE